MNNSQNVTQGNGGPASTATKVYCGQINLAKSRYSTDEFSLLLSAFKGEFIYFLQEPWIRRGKLMGMPRNTKLYYIAGKDGSVPRAAIIASAGLNLWIRHEYSDPDCITCSWAVEDFPRDIFLVSAYCDIKKPLLSPTLLKVFNSIGGTGTQAVISLDANAHSATWQHTMARRDPRGEELEQAIISRDIDLCNLGNTPTYVARGAATVIDLTLATSGIRSFIRKWEVEVDDQFSDHRLIRFQVSFHCDVTTTIIRLWKNADWKQYELLLCNDTIDWKPPAKMSCQKLDEETEKFTNMLMTHLDVICPEKSFRSTRKRPEWWSADLNDMKKAVNKAHQLALKDGTTDLWEEFKYLRREYKYEKRSVQQACWREHCTSQDSFKQMAALQKAMNKTVGPDMGVLKKDGQYLASPAATVEYLLEEHFPDCKDTNNQPLPSGSIKTKDIYQLDFPKEEVVEAALRSFGTNKAAGPDGIKGWILRAMPRNVVSRLRFLYMASLALEYVPKLWRQSRVVFIPKLGKATYEDPRSFRPISLTSFLFKTMERVIFWTLEEGALKTHPLNKNQHAFRRGHSTDTALSATLQQIESFVLNQKYALVAFLDISGAFDNVSIEAAVRGMRSKHFPEPIVKWFSYYLAHRIASVDIKGIKCVKHLVKGTPQGGVLSPIIWNLIFDSFLSMMDQDPFVNAVGFADDGCLITGGNCPRILRSRMQRAVKKSVGWGGKGGLTFSPAKTVVVLFSKKHKPDYPDPIFMNGHAIEYSKEAKYLGIWLHHKLSWTLHIKKKADKTRRALFMVKAMAGTVWGPDNKMMKWCYSGIVRPGFTYGAIVWAKALALKSNLSIVRRINRLAALSVVHVRKGTPTAALELMLGIVPLEIFLHGIVAKAFVRVCRVNKLSQDVYDTFKGGHMNYARDIATECGLLNLPLDEITKEVNWTKHFVLEKFDDKKPPPLTDIVAYTDGSKDEDDYTGSAFVVYDNDIEIARGTHYRGLMSTVFQAEVYAIGAAITFLLTLPNLGNKIWIASDSQAALLAITGHVIKSPLVRLIRDQLNLLGDSQDVHLTWVKAHVGLPGNEMADSLAKLATREFQDGPEPLDYAPLAVVEDLIWHSQHKLWNQKWHNEQAYRQTKIWYPDIPRKLSQRLCLEDRLFIKQFIALLTGHNEMNRHLNVCDQFAPAFCRTCLLPGVEETSWHVIAECKALNRLRKECFGVIQITDPTGWKYNSMRKFIQHEHICALLQPQY